MLFLEDGWSLLNSKMASMLTGTRMAHVVFWTYWWWCFSRNYGNISTKGINTTCGLILGIFRTNLLWKRRISEPSKRDQKGIASWEGCWKYGPSHQKCGRLPTIERYADISPSMTLLFHLQRTNCLMMFMSMWIKSCYHILCFAVSRLTNLVG